MSSPTRIITPRLELALISATSWIDVAIEMLDRAIGQLGDGAPSSTAERGREVRAELLEAFDEARAGDRMPEYATLEEAVAALRADPWCPRDVSDKQLAEWARLFVRAQP